MRPLIGHVQSDRQVVDFRAACEFELQVGSAKRVRPREDRYRGRALKPPAFFPHDHARSRAYRWNEDGLAGFCDRDQHRCLALALLERARRHPRGTAVRPVEPWRQSRRGRQGVLLPISTTRRRTPTRGCSTSSGRRINSWRWKDVPFYIRAGRQLATTPAEVAVRLRSRRPSSPPCRRPL